MMWWIEILDSENDSAKQKLERLVDLLEPKGAFAEICRLLCTGLRAQTLHDIENMYSEMHSILIRIGSSCGCDLSSKDRNCTDLIRQGAMRCSKMDWEKFCWLDPKPVWVISPRNMESSQETIIAMSLAFFLLRQYIGHAWAWSLPCERAIREAAHLCLERGVGRLFDVGGGKGLWTKAFCAHGIDTICVNKKGRDEYTDSSKYFCQNIEICSAEHLCDRFALRPKDALLLSWVPRGFAAKPFVSLVRQFPGKYIFVVSESSAYQHATSGSHEFWKTLERFARVKTWELSSRVPGYFDTIFLYVRRGIGCQDGCLHNAMACEK